MAEIKEETPVTESLDEIEAQQPEEEPEPDQAEDEEQDAEDDSITVSIGDEEPEEPEESAEAPQWVKDLRHKHKDLKRQNSELQKQLEQYKPKAPVIGAKPTLAGCDYDEEEFIRQTDEWYESKRAADMQQAQRQKAEEAAAMEYRQKVERYQEKKQSLKVKDYADAEATVEDLMDAMQQTVILETADNPALVVYALGKNPTRAAEMAGHKNPVKFAYELSKLEATLKINKRKPKAAPESRISGTGRISGATDNQLERLRAEAAKTGDMSKVLAYKRKKAKAG